MLLQSGHLFWAKILLTFVTYFRLSKTAPIIEVRDTDPTTFSDLELFSQFSAASYCPSDDDNGNTATKITCPTYNNCPLVEARNVESVYEFQNSLLTDVTGYVAVDTTNSLIVLAFRGTHSIRNRLTDVEIVRVATDICDGCTAAEGFYGSWIEARSGVVAAISRAFSTNPSFKLVITGHSLGGAIANLAAAELRNNPSIPTTIDLYTYGAPRTGNDALANYITSQAPAKGANYRVTHNDDPIPRVPPKFLGYEHPSPQYYISSGTGVAVTEGAVQEYTTGDGGDDGDDLPVNLFNLDIAAHLWYFGNISACDKGQGVDF